MILFFWAKPCPSTVMLCGKQNHLFLQEASSLLGKADKEQILRHGSCSRCRRRVLTAERWGISERLRGSELWSLQQHLTKAVHDEKLDGQNEMFFV